MEKKEIKLAAVVVTYNRLEKLKTTLSYYEQQKSPCSHLVVVNNCSTDGTEAYLDEWKNIEVPFCKHVLKTPSNIGGAGGFYTGMEYAMGLGVDWIWVGDDDAYPDSKAFSIFYDYLKVHDCEKLAAICSSVLLPNGEYSWEHRSRFIKGFRWKRISCEKQLYEQDEFYIDYTSYVGSVFNVKALNKCGLCVKDMFIYYDDSEHSLRLHDYGQLICIPSIRVIHDAPQEIKSTGDTDLSWKLYYEIRNSIYCYKKHHFINALYISLLYYRSYANMRLMGICNKESMRLIKLAICDGWKGHLGLHEIYKPGFKIHNEIPENPNLYLKLYRKLKGS